MTTMRACFIFLGGLVLGISLTAVLFSLPRAVAAPDSAAGFPDVPAGHYAATAIHSLKAKGVIQGYPGGKYLGNLPVTRYEAAVALARFAQYYEKAHAPLSVTSSAAPVSTSTPPGHWAKASQDYLAVNSFASPTSPLFQSPGTKPLSANEFADASSMVLDRLSSRALPITTH